MRKYKREVTDKQEQKEIIAKCDVCKVALIDGEYPYIIPLNFGVKYKNERPVFYFHCAKEGRKLDIIKQNPNCAFLLDCSHELVPGSHAHNCTMHFESIMGQGKIEIVDSAAERHEALTLLMEQYGQKGPFEFPERVLDLTCVLRLTAETMTAKRNK